MQILIVRGNAGMAERIAHRHQGGPTVQAVTGMAVAQPMWRHVALPVTMGLQPFGNLLRRKYLTTL